MPTEQSTAESWDWQYLLDAILKHRRELILANIISVCATLFSVPIPLLMPLLVDEVLLDHPGTMIETINGLFPSGWQSPWLYILSVLALSLVLRLGAMLFNVLQSRQFTLIAKDITYRLRHRLLAHLGHVSMAEYESLGSGAVSSHLVTDINVIDTFIGATVSRFLVAILTLIGVSIVLLWMQWQLALFIMLLNPIVVFFTIRMGDKVKSLKSKENSALEAFQQSLTETLDAMQQIRASNREQYFLGEVDKRAHEVKTHAASYAWKRDTANRFSYYIFLSGFEVFRAIAMLMVVFSDLTVGQMMAVFGYLWYMMTPVQSVLGIQYSWFSAKAALQRLNGLLALDPEPDYPHLVNPFKDQHTVTLKVSDICFSYGDGPLVLDHVNLDIKAGEKVALVGASGGGKSTLVQVVLGLYPPTSGQILFNQQPHDKIGLDTIRENVATVLQNPAMLNDSVRMNLTLGRVADDKKIWQALEIAQLNKTVNDLPDGLDTIIGKQGVRLSGGQRQRIAVARMILSDPKVVILDEATSALDTITEANLHKALGDFLENRTTLIIAHRLSAVKQADQVYVFDSGQIIEQGHHNELIQNDGLYQKLYGNIQT